MRHVRVRFTNIGLIGVLVYAVLPASYVLAQEISQPRMIEDAQLATFMNRLGQNMVRDGVARVPFSIKLEASSVEASDQQAKIVTDPATAACVDLLGQNLMRNGAAKVPFVIRATPER